MTCDEEEFPQSVKNDVLWVALQASRLDWTEAELRQAYSEYFETKNLSTLANKEEQGESAAQTPGPA
jgi:hypothetical protein